MIITCTMTIAATPGQLFHLTQDYQLRQQWDSFPGRSYLIAGAQPGKGAVVRTESRMGLWMESEYIAYKPPKASCIRMLRGSAIFAHFTGNWRFDAVDSEHSRVTFTYDLLARPNWLTPMVAAAFRRVTRKRLDGLKAYVET